MPDMKSLTIDGVKYDVVDETARNRVDLGLTGATVGQIAKITAVDAEGKPTAWSPMYVYSSAEIDAALGAYITDIDALIGGDA